MQALYFEEQRGYQAVRIGERPMPVIGDDDVLVRVKAFSLNHLDVWVMNGRYPAPIPLPHIFGSDGAGIVEQAGKQVTTARPGDEVVIFPGLSCGHCPRCLTGRDNECNSFSVQGVLTPGTAAQYVKVPAVNIFRKPEGLSFAEASGIGITYSTAWNSLVLRGGIEPGDNVLVHGGGSGAGTALIQTAKLFNATVITTVGDDWKAPKAKELGADYIINHGKEDFAEAVKRITNGRLCDIAVDHVGRDTFNRSLSCLKRGGRLITFGATSGDEVNLSLRYVFGKNIAIHGVYVGPRGAFEKLLRLFPNRLRTVVDSVFAFEDVLKAYEKLLSRQFFGKIVVRV